MIMYLQMIETDEDKSKFEEIYTAYRGLMYHIAYQKLHNREDAEDVVHYAFVKIAENITNIEPVCPKTKQLVVTIVCNRVIDLYRTQRRHDTLEFRDDLDNGTSYEMDADGYLGDCISKLPDKQRSVIWLKYYHGYTLRETARILDISLSNAQKLDQRAKKELEKLYLEGGGSF